MQTQTVLDFFKTNIPELYKAAAEASHLDDDSDWNYFVGVFKKHQPRLQFEAVRPYSQQVEKLMADLTPKATKRFVINVWECEPYNGYVRKMLRFGYIENGQLKQTSVAIR